MTSFAFHSASSFLRRHAGGAVRTACAAAVLSAALAAFAAPAEARIDPSAPNPADRHFLGIVQGAPEAQQEINRICLFGRYDDCERLVLYRPMLLETYVPADRKNDFVAFSSESGRRNYFAHVDGIRTTVSEASAANRTLIAQVKSLDRLEQQLSRINHWRLVTFHNHLKRFEPITKGFELARKIMAKNKPYISGSSNPFGVFLYDARLEGVVSAKGVVGPGIFNSFSDLSAQYVSHLLFLQSAKKEIDAVAKGLDEAIAARNKARRVLARKLPQEYAKPMAEYFELVKKLHDGLKNRVDHFAELVDKLRDPSSDSGRMLSTGEIEIPGIGRIHCGSRDNLEKATRAEMQRLRAEWDAWTAGAR